MGFFFVIELKIFDWNSN